MSSDVAIALVSSVSSGGFALLGVALAHGASARRQRAAYRAETALALASTEILMWGDNWIELRADLERQMARLAAAGVPDDLAQAFRTITVACWRDLQEDLMAEQENAGITTALLEAREDANRAIRAFLLAKESRRARRSLRGRALANVQAVSNERSVEARKN